jgi:hypothetical protein
VSFLLWLLGLGAIAAGASAASALLTSLVLAPVLVWLSWNVLDLGHAVGASELGLWGILLAAVFLATGFGTRVLIVALVFLVEPDWLHRSAELRWPSPTFRHFVAICLLLAVASISASAPARSRDRQRWWPA